MHVDLEDEDDSMGPLDWCHSYRPPPTVSACPHLEQELDWDHEGEDTDLIEIARYMFHWEEISTLLGLTDADVFDIKDRYQGKPDLQR